VGERKRERDIAGKIESGINERGRERECERERKQKREI
jgi:hypothetical protein